jgi:hypothetical protein
MSHDHEPTTIVLRSEFATVSLKADYSGNGSRLGITDMRTGHVAYFDPLELEALAWSTHDDLRPLLNPEKRWISDEH